MTRISIRFALICAIALLASASAFGDEIQRGASPPFGSMSAGVFDKVNNANLNVHFAIPVLVKAGRGLPLNYLLTYDNMVWRYNNNVWNPVTQWGWRGITETLLGVVTYDQTQGSCTSGGNTYFYNIYSDWDYHGPDGFTAEFGESIQISDQSTTTPPGCTPTGPPYSATWTAIDGSGFILSATAAPSATVYPRSGGSISPPVNSSTGSGSGTMIDSNGNELTVTALTNTTFTDTLGTTAITAAGSGTPSSPITYTYTSAAGGSAQVTVNYTAYTVQTNFGCSGISEYGPTSNNLVSSISLPDGTSYSFTYEATPGHAGNVTGRLASVTLSTGGQITYAYSGSNNGITCNYAIAPTFTRTTPDGTWTYTHTESGSAWTTTTTDPQSNQTLYNFQVASGVSNGYETEPKVYQGSSGSGTLLETVDTCIPDVAGFCLGMAVLPLVAAFAAVLYTILYTAIYVAPFVCLGHYVWRRCCR